MFTVANYKEIELTKFGGLYTEAPANRLPPGASPQNWDVDFLIASVGTRPGLSDPGAVFQPAIPVHPVGYLKSAQLLGPQSLTLAEDGGTTLYQENLTTPGAFNAFYTGILNAARAISETVDQREYIGLSNLVQGTDQPRQYDGTYLDRISQVGPGAGPSVTVSAPAYPIISITEIFPTHTINSLSWGASINLYTAQPASTNLYFLGATSDSHFLDDLSLGDLVYVSGVAGIGGQNPNGTYAVTATGSFTDVDGTYSYFGVTATVSNSGFARGSAGGTYQKTPALVQLSTPIPLQNAVVGGEVTLEGSSVASWNRTWKIAETPTEGQLSITSTSLTANVATYDYVVQSGEAPGWQSGFIYPIAAQIVDSAGNVWQVTTPGTSGGTIPPFTSSPQTDNTVVWAEQPSTTKVLATVFNTNNGGGIFNVQNQPITSANSTSFTLAITSPNVTAAAEDGQAVTGSGTALIIDPGTITLGTGNPGVDPIYGNATGGNVLVLNPLVAAGQRYAVLLFLTRNGFITPASPPVSFYTTGESAQVSFTKVAIGPPDVIARIAAFTLANAGAGGPYFWVPDDVTVQGSAAFLGVTTTFNKTVLEDNTSATFGPLTISDAVLAASQNISDVGNNLQQQRELGECVKIVQWAGRCFYLGERTKVDQFVNLTFDGGAIGGLPAGWTVSASLAPVLSLIDSFVFGQSLYIGGASGSLVVDLYSPSAGTNWPATILMSSMGTSLLEFTNSFNNPLWDTVPSDLILRIYPSNLGPTECLSQSAYETQGLLAPIIQPNTAYSLRLTCASPLGNDVIIDRMEVFASQQPVYTLQVAASYADNTEAIDGVTGAIDTSIVSSNALTNEFVFLNKLYLTTRSAAGKGQTLSPIQSGTGEPSSWPVDEISNSVGSLGPLADDVGEEYVLIADDAGVYIFDGGNHLKISQEIQQIWDALYAPSKSTVGILNDLKQQRILVGVPLPTPNQWLPNAPANPTPAYPNVILMCSVLSLPNGNAIGEGMAVHVSAFSGNLLYHDGRRKWTIWQIPAATAAWIDRPGGGEQIWFGRTS